MNAGTLFVLIIVIAVLALALRSVLRKKGGCGCGGDDDAAGGCDCSSCSSCSGCDGCAKIYGINVDADGNPL